METKQHVHMGTSTQAPSSSVQGPQSCINSTFSLILDVLQQFKQVQAHTQSACCAQGQRNAADVTSKQNMHTLAQDSCKDLQLYVGFLRFVVKLDACCNTKQGV